MTEGVLSFVRTWLLYAVAVYAFRRLGVVTWMERRRGRAAQPGGGDAR